MNDVTKNGLVDRAKAILTNPRQEWPRIAADPASIADVFKGYALPLLVIGPIARFIGLTMIGMNFGFMTYRVPMETGLTVLVAGIVGAAVSLVFLTLIAEFLAPQFGGVANRNNAFKLVVYSMTATWIASVLLILPALSILVLLAAIYGFYLLYLGASPLMKVPADKAAVYIVILIVCGIVAQYILNRLTMSLAMPSLPFG